jgi:hypothetical protein
MFAVPFFYLNNNNDGAETEADLKPPRLRAKEFVVFARLKT